ELYDRYLGPGWHEKPADMEIWKRVMRIPDPELWRTHARRRERLVAFARSHLHKQLAKRGASATELAAAQEILDPEALTIGFARRFATYKRANLILADRDRLAALLNNPSRHVQIIFAGKAHPRDNPGKDLIRQIVHIARQEHLRRSLVFLADYDMNVARYLTQGVDVWLSTPLRPMEASGTSGMKVAANGGLNLSVLDGWWDEGYETAVGWAIGSGETYDDLEYQNAVESQALCNLLEKEIVPLFYERGPDNLPRGWIARMKAAMATLAPVFNTNRMVRQYGEMFYAPAAKRWELLTEGQLRKARELSSWKDRLAKEFSNIRVESVSDNMNTNGGAHVGKEVRVEAVVNLGKLAAEDVRVELYYGPLDEDGQFAEGHQKALSMERVNQAGGTEKSNGRQRYVAHMPCVQSGQGGYTVRVLPQHELLVDAREMAMIRWA
ncbi:MAG: alpha-glucan family phosphorylase, partial [Planctomycetota bacterium]